MWDNFSEWWAALSTVQKIYWGFAIPFSILFVLQMVLTFVGGDAELDGDADFDVEHDSGAGFQFFTIKNFIAFFTIFAWTGIACIDSNLGNLATLGISTGAGLVMMALMAAIFYFFGKLTSSGTFKTANAKGGVGEIYLTVKAKRGNIGKISIIVQGSLRELDAITDDEEDLTNGMVVNVKEVINGNLLLVSRN